MTLVGNLNRENCIVLMYWHIDGFLKQRWHLRNISKNKTKLKMREIDATSICLLCLSVCLLYPISNISFKIYKEKRQLEEKRLKYQIKGAERPTMIYFLVSRIKYSKFNFMFIFICVLLYVYVCACMYGLCVYIKMCM